MLVLNEDPPEFVPVRLGGDAVMRLRPATQADVDECSAKAQRDLMGLVAGADAGKLLATVLGDDFNVDGLEDMNKVSAAAERLAEIHLVMACQDGWSGVGTKDGPIEKPAPEYVALLLNSPQRRRKIMVVINADIHEEITEKKESPVSPNGGAGIPTGARNAAASASPVPAAGAS